MAGMLCRSGWLARRSYGFAGRPRRVPAPDKFDDSVGRDFSGCQKRHAKDICLRLLQKTLGNGVFDVAMIVALLCFWTEEQDGKLQYMHEEGVVSL